MSDPDGTHAIRLRTFLILAIAWFAGAYFAGHYMARMPFGFVVASVLLFAIPIALSGLYSSAVHQTHALSRYKEGGRAYKLLGGRVIRAVLWMVFALAASLFMLLQFSGYSGLEWVALLLAAPVYWLSYLVSRKFWSVELKKPSMVTEHAIVWARVWCPLILLVIYAGLVLAFSNAENYASLSEALAAKRPGVGAISSSAVVQVALQLITFADGLKAYLAGNLQQFSEYLPLLLKIIGGYVVFFNACATFACFVIPLPEYRRVFGPLSDDEPPPPLPASRVAMASALITSWHFSSMSRFLPYWRNGRAITRMSLRRSRKWSAWPKE